MMDYCLTALLNQGMTSVPQWGQGHPYEIKSVPFQRTSSSSSSSTNSYASAEGMLLVVFNLSSCYHDNR